MGVCGGATGGNAYLAIRLNADERDVALQVVADQLSGHVPATCEPFGPDVEHFDRHRALAL